MRDRLGCLESLADVLADPVQRALAARAGLVLDVDERLDARQLGRQGAAVGAPFARSLRARGGRLGFVRLGLSRLALLDVFERQQKLIFRQALGAATKAVSLQFLDDRNKPFCTQARRSASPSASRERREAPRRPASCR
jgi:hypothetical protein